MRVALIRVPYHLGRLDEGLGAGVPLLAEAVLGAVEAAEERDVRVSGIDPFNDIGGSMAVVRAIAEEVGGAIGKGLFPLVLSGNCNSSLGTVTATGADDLGVVWLDAHADFNTPETTRTGFFDGFALSMLTGEGWKALREGLATVPQEHVVHVGARDVEPEEEARLASSRILRVGPEEEVESALDELARRVGSIYLHVDLDVLDPSAGAANWYAAPGGLSLDAAGRVVAEVARRFSIRAAALTAYTPDCDPERRIPAAARALAARIVAVAAPAPLPA